MLTSRLLRLPALLSGAILVLVAACGGTATTPPPVPNPVPTAAPSLTPPPTPAPTASPSPAGAVTAILVVTSEGGFINPVASLSAVPSVVVESDGRIFMLGAPSATDGLVPAIEVRDTGAGGAAAIIEALKAAGLDHELTGGGPAADTGATVFTVTIDGQTSVSRFSGGGMGGPGGPGTPGGAPGGAPGASGPTDAKVAAMDLLARLTDPSIGWGGPAVAPTSYTPLGYRIWAEPVDPPASGSTAAWPLAAGLAAFGTPATPDFGLVGMRTGALTGADAATVRPVLESAAPGTLFTGGGTWTLFVRPLLPDELGP